LSSSTSRAPSVIVVTGPSGAGKGTLIREVLQRVPGVEASVSATTRERRPGEQDGREYHFIGLAEFLDRIEQGDLLEHVTYVSGHRYGTLRSEIDRIRAEGKVPLLELETEGALKVRDEDSHAVTIFIRAPVGELERRLRERATESSGEIQVRLDLARKQREQRDRFDHLIVNDDVKRAADDLQAIVQRELQAAGTMSRP